MIGLGTHGFVCGEQLVSLSSNSSASAREEFRVKLENKDALLVSFLRKTLWLLAQPPLVYPKPASLNSPLFPSDKSC